MDFHSCAHQCLSRTFRSDLFFFFISQRKSRRSSQHTGEEANSGGCWSSARCRLSSTVSSGINSSCCDGFHSFHSLCAFQGGPGHLYLLKNKVATFAKVEKEEDMSQWVSSAVWLTDCLLVNGQMDSKCPSEASQHLCFLMRRDNRLIDDKPSTSSSLLIQLFHTFFTKINLQLLKILIMAVFISTQHCRK